MRMHSASDIMAVDCLIGCDRAVMQAVCVVFKKSIQHSLYRDEFVH